MRSLIIFLTALALAALATFALSPDLLAQELGPYDLVVTEPTAPEVTTPELVTEDLPDGNAGSAYTTTTEAPVPTLQPAPQPLTQPVAQPTPEPTTVAQPVAQPAFQPTVQPNIPTLAQATPQPTPQPMVQPQPLAAPYSGQPLADVAAPQEVFRTGHLQVTASSAAGQSEYAALTSARYVAMKRILETVQGLNLTGQTTIRDGMLQSEVIQASVSGFVQGAVECGKSYDPVRGIGTVCLRLGVTGQGGLYDTVYPVIQSELNITPLPQYQSAAPAPPQPHDGLIVDVRAFPGFRPAMVNRILVDNDTVIFEPARVASAILVERGCGGYTNTLDKARAQLESWGCANPLVIAAVGVQNGSDVVITVDDADAAFSDNETTNMFANARVVYLLQ